MNRIMAGVLLGALSMLPVLAPGGAARADGQAPFATVEAQLHAMRRIQCSAVDGQPVTFFWHGNAYSRVPGEADRLLFKVEGMNTRQCGPLAGSTNPAEFRLVSREILIYKDPVSGEVLRRWQNPWTGATVEVIHVANDPVNGRYTAVGRDGKPTALPFSVGGPKWWLTVTVPLFYTNPLAGDFQRYIGGTYHATEMFNFFGDVADFAPGGPDSAPVFVGWERISTWLPWMEMGDRAGLMYFHTAGRKLDRWDELSPALKAEIDARYPAYRQPPPLDDARPNETSWTYFRKVLGEKQGQ